MAYEKSACRSLHLQLCLRMAALVGLGLCGMVAADSPATQPRRVSGRAVISRTSFSNGPTDIANVAGIVPLGNLNPGADHTLAVDHMYLRYPVPSSEGAYAYPVYAMGDGAVIAVLHSRATGRVDPNYRIFIGHSDGLTSYLDHMNELSPRLEGFLDTVPGPAWIDLGGADRMLLLGQLGAPEPLPVKGGEQLGVTKSYGETWAVGVIDARRHTFFEGRGARRYPTYADSLQLLGLEAQPLFPGQQTINAACFIEYLRDEIRSAWTQLLVSTPRGCGRSGWDLPGELRGAWFNPAIDATSPAPVSDVTSAAVSVIPDNFAPTTRVQIGIASGGRFSALDPDGRYPQLRPPLQGDDGSGRARGADQPGSGSGRSEHRHGVLRPRVRG